MFNVRISGIAAGLAFILSFLLGIAGGASFPTLLLKPLIFAILFFIIAGLAYFLVSHFLPELMDETWEPETEEDVPGSRVNITEEEPSAQAFYAAAKADDSEDNLGNISDLIGTDEESGGGLSNNRPEMGMDQQGKDQYTRRESGASVDAQAGFGMEGASRPAEGIGRAAGTFPASVSGGDPVDVLPDLDSLAGAFLPGSGEDAADTTEYSTSAAPAKRPSASSKGQKMEGDFNPKELAAGIRTILKKEG
jgi:hypothetical protein